MIITKPMVWVAMGGVLALAAIAMAQPALAYIFAGIAAFLGFLEMWSTRT